MVPVKVGGASRRRGCRCGQGRGRGPGGALLSGACGATGGNVLLCSDSNNSRGFVAKVADFGMARVLDVDERIQTRMYGTITHMPPERLSCHVLDKVGAPCLVSLSFHLHLIY